MEDDFFEPLGAQAEWKTLYGHLKKVPLGTVVTYRTISTLLDRPFEENRSPVYRAIKELEANDRRTLVNVRGEGYRVAEPDEHEKLARRHIRSSHRQLTKAKGKTSSAPRQGLSPEARRRLDALDAHLGDVRKVVLSLNRKQSETDAKLAQVREQAKADRRNAKHDVATLSSKLDHVTDLLARHGITDDENAPVSD